MTDSSDTTALTRLMMRYCDSIDSGDLDGCAALFASGAWGIVGDMAHGEAEVRGQLNNVTLYDGKPNTRHIMTNVCIQIADSGKEATAQSCITVMQSVPGDFALQAIFIGTYHDVFVKENGAWRFQERAITPDLLGDMSRHRADMA